jgi:hypothetical protein
MILVGPIAGPEIQAYGFPHPKEVQHESVARPS